MIRIRTGTPDDVAAALALLDRATAWLVAQGRTGQWGTEPQSTNPFRIRMLNDIALDGGLHLACVDDQVAGMLAIAAPPSHIPPAGEPEVYVRLLVTDRERAGQGLGSRLLDHARHLARERGVDLLRLDCYAGGDQALVRYYERQGFSRTEAFSVDRPDGPWPGQVLAQRTSPSPPPPS